MVQSLFWFFRVVGSDLAKPQGGSPHHDPIHRIGDSCRFRAREGKIPREESDTGYDTFSHDHSSDYFCHWGLFFICELAYNRQNNRFSLGTSSTRSSILHRYYFGISLWIRCLPGGGCPNTWGQSIENISPCHVPNYSTRYSRWRPFCLYHLLR